MSPRPRIPDDYVDVAERIRGFKTLYPEGSLQSLCDPKLIPIGDRTFIAYAAAAYRTPDDQRPGIGWAWEPVPGPTPFTKDSELMNAETSAWGRAIVALGFETKKIASSEEVRNRSEGADPSAPPSDTAPSDFSVPTAEQKARMKSILAQLKKADDSVKWEEVGKTYVQSKLNRQDSSLLDATEYEALLTHMWDKLEKAQQRQADAVPFE